MSVSWFVYRGTGTRRTDRSFAGIVDVLGYVIPPLVCPRVCVSSSTLLDSWVHIPFVTFIVLLTGIQNIGWKENWQIGKLVLKKTVTKEKGRQATDGMMDKLTRICRLFTLTEYANDHQRWHYILKKNRLKDIYKHRVWLTDKETDTVLYTERRMHR